MQPHVEETLLTSASWSHILCHSTFVPCSINHEGFGRVPWPLSILANQTIAKTIYFIINPRSFCSSFFAFLSLKSLNSSLPLLPLTLPSPRFLSFPSSWGFPPSCPEPSTISSTPEKKLKCCGRCCSAAMMMLDSFSSLLAATAPFPSFGRWSFSSSPCAILGSWTLVVPVDVEDLAWAAAARSFSRRNSASRCRACCCWIASWRAASSSSFLTFSRLSKLYTFQLFCGKILRPPCPPMSTRQNQTIHTRLTTKLALILLSAPTSEIPHNQAFFAAIPFSFKTLSEKSSHAENLLRLAATTTNNFSFLPSYLGWEPRGYGVASKDSSKVLWWKRSSAISFSFFVNYCRAAGLLR